MALGIVAGSARPASAQASVTTYHYDARRTGWNQNESVLTPANVGSSAFGLLHNVTLDDQVDAQPLVMPGVQITAGNYQGTHDVAYVATENNTVYAIDVHSGTILLSPNFGTPVSYPLGCGNNGPNVGINSTPVIDPSSNTLYVMVYTQASSGPTWTLHALSLGSLSDKVTPQVVSASHTLSNGTTFNFNATYQRQRAGLLLANGSIYAGFGSFCDMSANLSRGWLLGWTAGTLQPFPSNQLNDQQPTAPNSFFLSSVWMSGYGPAADDSGNILFVTGNSDPSGTTYDGVTNIQESVVKMSSTLSSVESIFTPSNQSTLDQEDADFGSGGVLVLPDQPGSTPHLAVAAGKVGSMYLMNEDSLGGYSTTGNNVLGTYQIGMCWCGQSYYVDPLDGLGRVVSSGGNTVDVWRVQTSPTPSLTSVTTANVSATSIQDPGFFTSVSSNGTANPIIWAISRPVAASNGEPISLYAFNPDSPGSTMTQLFQATAGAWPNYNGNANLVPVVANGQVFVASNKQLQIFGLNAAPAAAPTFSPAPGTYTSTQTVTLSDSTPGAVIHCTTNGAAPTASSPVCTSVSVSATTTIQAIAVASGYTSSAAAIGAYTFASGNNSVVNLSSYYNVEAIASVGTAPLNGGFDTSSYAYNSALLGASATYAGLTFPFGPANAPDGVSGATIPVASASYTQLYLLGAAAYGPVANQSIVVTYTDGTSSTFTQSFSDWGAPQKYAGETQVANMTSRVNPDGTASTLYGPWNVYGYTFNLTAGKTPASVKLPANRDVIFLGVGWGGAASAPPAFSLSAASKTFTLAANQGGTDAITVTPASGFSGNVTFSIAGLPAGVDYAFSPTSSTTGTTLVIWVPPGTAASTSTITVTGTSGSNTASTALTFVVSPPAPGFTVSTSAASFTLAANQGGTLGVNVTPANGFTGNVSFSISGLPAGVDYAFTPTSSTTGTTLVLWVPPGTASSTSTLTVTGTSGSATASTTFTFIVTAAPPSFSLTTSVPTFTLAPNQGGTLAVNVVPANGFTGTVSFNASGFPSGPSFTYLPASSTTGATLVIFAPSTTKPGNYTITVTGTSGSTTASTTFTLVIS